MSTRQARSRSFTITQRYNIYFAGELLEGFSRETVQENLLRLFGTDRRTVETLFSGKPRLVKKHCDKATALKYQQAMRRCGAKPVIRPVKTDSRPGAAQAESQSRDNTVSSPAGEHTSVEFSLAPAGADMLRPDERNAPTSVEVDTSGLSLAPVFEPAPGREDQAPAATMRETSLSLQPLQAPPPQPPRAAAPRVTSITLAPPETDLADCTPARPAPPSLDLSGIRLEPEAEDKGARAEPGRPDTPR